jgi:hypothetical protein
VCIGFPPPHELGWRQANMDPARGLGFIHCRTLKLISGGPSTLDYRLAQAAD